MGVSIAPPEVAMAQPAKFALHCIRGGGSPSKPGKPDRPFALVLEMDTLTMMHEASPQMVEKMNVRES